jgi:hypothetical protein
VIVKVVQVRDTLFGFQAGDCKSTGGILALVDYSEIDQIVDLKQYFGNGVRVRDGGEFMGNSPDRLQAHFHIPWYAPPGWKAAFLLTSKTVPLTATSIGLDGFVPAT